MAISNRSLERGLAILECFKPGVDLLAHRDWCEQTGLPKATVTRLVRTLCDRGYLVQHAERGSYGLGPPILSLARAMVLNHPLLAVMSPVVQEVAERTGAMVGFGTAHDLDIVYLEGANRDQTRPSRRIGQGTRIPIASSSIGHAWLAGLAPSVRAREIARLRAAIGRWSRDNTRAIESSLRQIQSAGYCAVSYNEGKHIAVGAPVRLAENAVYAVNIAYRVPLASPEVVPRKIEQALQELVQHALGSRGAGA